VKVRTLKILRELGFSPTTFSETIVVTEISNGIWNCAPMGVKLENGNLYFYVYEGARTLDALRRKKYLTINIVYDVSVFMKCIFKKCSNEELYEPSSKFPIPHIASADAYIECELLSLKEVNGKFKAVCKPINVVIKRSIPRTFNRAFPAIIEALIYYTKIKPFKRLKLKRELKKLIERLIHCKYIVEHSTSNREYLEYIEKIISEVLKELEEIANSASNGDD